MTPSAMTVLSAHQQNQNIIRWRLASSYGPVFRRILAVQHLGDVVEEPHERVSPGDEREHLRVAFDGRETAVGAHVLGVVLYLRTIRCVLLVTVRFIVRERSRSGLVTGPAAQGVDPHVEITVIGFVFICHGSSFPCRRVLFEPLATLARRIEGHPEPGGDVYEATPLVEHAEKLPLRHEQCSGEFVGVELI